MTMLRKAIDLAHFIAITLVAAVMAVILWQLLKGDTVMAEKTTARDIAHRPENLAKRGPPVPGIKLKGGSVGKPQVGRVEDVRKL